MILHSKYWYIISGSDGHTIALTKDGCAYSWGDGDYGKLGHGSSMTEKLPTLIKGALNRRVRIFSTCINQFVISKIVKLRLVLFYTRNFLLNLYRFSLSLI